MSFPRSKSHQPEKELETFSHQPTQALSCGTLDENLITQLVYTGTNCHITQSNKSMWWAVFFPQVILIISLNVVKFTTTHAITWAWCLYTQKHHTQCPHLKYNPGFLKEILGQWGPYNDPTDNQDKAQSAHETAVASLIRENNIGRRTHWRMWMWRYLPKRLELLLRMVLAFPKLSRMGNTSMGWSRERKERELKDETGWRTYVSYKAL